MSSCRRIRDDLVDQSPAASHSQEILEVNLLIVILWVDNRQSTFPTTLQSLISSTDVVEDLAFDFYKSLVVYTDFHYDNPRPDVSSIDGVSDC